MHADFTDMFIVLASVNANIIEHKGPIIYYFCEENRYPNCMCRCNFHAIFYNNQLLMSIIKKFCPASCNQFCIKTNQSLKREKNIYFI